MTILRYVVKAALVSAVICSLVLAYRYQAARRVQAAAAQAQREGYAPAPGQPDKTIPPVVIPELARLTDALPDLLWMEEGMIRGHRDIPILVDPSVERVLFVAVGATKKAKVTLTPPPRGGKTVSPRIESAEMPKGTWISVDRPDAGTWTFRVDAQDTVSIAVRAKTAFGLEPIRVMHPKADGTVEDYAGVLDAGEAELLAVYFTGETPPSEFILMGPESLRLLDLGPPIEQKKITDRKTPAWHLLFRLPVPEIPFRLLVRGVDAGGHPFQRVSLNVLESEPVRGYEQLNFLATGLSAKDCKRIQELTPILLPHSKPAARASLLCIRNEGLRLRLSYPPSSDRLHSQHFKLYSAPFRPYSEGECRDLLGFFARLPQTSRGEFAEAHWSATCKDGRFALDFELAALVN